ncbi:MAG: YicC/YloC family endoribonuclease [Bacteroidales bacterium]|nr:YicC/YloC family endoribonuclease [Bacteroidales bacterium]
MKSMTGYAKKQCVINGKNIIIEIKTLNSKQMDCNVKMPSLYRSKELEIRSMINRLERGKIDFTLTEEASVESNATLNTELATARYNAMMQLANQLTHEQANTIVMNNLFNQSDIWNAEQANELSEEDWNALAKTINEAINEVDQFRIHEGQILRQDFVKHVDLIEQKLQQIPQYEAERIDTAKERIRKYMIDFEVKNVDENRFEQEIIYYLEKLDITEEKVRLQKHINYFRETMNNEEGSGKKLGFIAQEMGREINTTGSKANHVAIQQLVVEMKDELEKIKEQLGNIL